MEFEASTIFQIAGMGIILALIHTILKQIGKEEIAHWVVVVGFVIILYMVASFVGDLFEEIQKNSTAAQHRVVLLQRDAKTGAKRL